MTAVAGTTLPQEDGVYEGPGGIIYRVRDGVMVAVMGRRTVSEHSGPFTRLRSAAEWVAERPLTLTADEADTVASWGSAVANEWGDLAREEAALLARIEAAGAGE
jgi:hypothetical protein